MEENGREREKEKNFTKVLKMASSSEASCISDPNFAVICAFLERFAKPCGITYPTFVDLQEMLENVEQVPKELVDLHIKLLRKARKTVFVDKWEKAVIKFCQSYSSQDGWEIERFGYLKSRLEVKLRVLKMLLEGQFDLNNKFKNEINTLEAGELRSKPIGKDKLGRIYWLQFDPSSNVRVYREDLDEDSWTLVAKDRSSLVELLQELSGDEYPLDLNSLNEDSTSLDKPSVDTGQNSNLSFKNEEHCESVIEKHELETSNAVKNEVNDECNKKSDDEKIKEINGHEITNGGTEVQEEQPLKKIKLSEDEDKTTSVDIKENENVGEAITEPVMHITGEGEGEDNQTGNVFEKAIWTEENSQGFLEDDIVGEAIEEPVMYITGEGAGEDCETGNPDKEENSQEKTEKESKESTEVETMPEKLKPPPKLWSIDTICGVNSKDTSVDEKQESVDIKTKQKTFSTFSIDSVLEKKETDCPTSENLSYPKFPLSANSSFLQTDETPKVFTDSLNLKTENTPTLGFNKCVSENESSEKNLESDGKTNEINNSSNFVSNIELMKPTTTSGVEKVNSEETVESSVEKVEVKNITPNISENKNSEEFSEDGNSEQTFKIDSKLLTEKEEVTKSLNLKDKNESNCNENLSKDKPLASENTETELHDCKAEAETLKTKEIHIENAQSSPKELTSVPDIKSEAQFETEKEETNLQKSEVENSSNENLKITGNNTCNVSDNLNAKSSLDGVEENFVPIKSSFEITSETANNYNKKSNDEEVENLRGTAPEVIAKTEELQKVSKVLSENKKEIENLEVDNSSEVRKEGNILTKSEVETTEKVIKPYEPEERELTHGKTIEFEEKVELKESKVTNESVNEAEVIESEKQFLESWSQSEDKREVENSSERKGLSDPKLASSENLKKLDEKEQALPESLEKNKSNEIEENKEKMERIEVEKSTAFGKDNEIFKDLSDDSINLLEPVEKNSEVENQKESLKSDPEPFDAKAETSVEVTDIVETTEESSDKIIEETEQNKSESKVTETVLPIKESAIKEEKVEQLSEEVVLGKEEEIKKEEVKSQSFQVIEQPKEALTMSSLSREKKDNFEEKEVELKLENKSNEVKEICTEMNKKVDLEKKEEKESSQEVTETSKVLRETKEIETEKNEKKQVEEIPKPEMVKQEDLTKEPKTMAVEDLKNFEEKLDIVETNENSIQEIKSPEKEAVSEASVQEKDEKPEIEETRQTDNTLEEVDKDEKQSKLKVSDIENKTKEEKLEGEKVEGIKEVKESSNVELKSEEENKTNLSELENIEKVQKSPQERKEEAKLTENSEEGNLKSEVVEESKDREEISKNEDEKADEEAAKQSRRRSRRGAEQIALEVNETPQRILRNRKVESEVKAESVNVAKKRKGKSKAEVNESQKEEKKVENKKEEEKENEKQEKGEEESEKNDESAPKEEKVVKKVAGEKTKKRRRRGGTFFSFPKRKQKKKPANAEKSATQKEGEQKEKKEKTEKTEKKRKRRGSLTLMAEETNTSPQKPADLETSTVRQSRRIAQIKLKEDAERRRLEEEQLKSFKSKKDKHSKSGKKKSKKNEDSDSYDDKKNGKDDSDNEKSKGKDGKRRRRKKKDKLKFNELNPWISSSGSSSAVEEEEELEEIEPPEDDELVFKSDHEFSPESDLEDPEYKPIKRARTAKVEESQDQVGKYDETACEKCGKTDHPEWILLCDKCDKGWHASCLRPALMVVPEGDWFCPPCEHISLITKLKESLIQYDKCQKQRENEELRRKRLAFVGISLDNVLPPNKKKVKTKDDEEDGDGSLSESESSSHSDSESESGSSDSSEPVYQLRQRRSNVTSYRYNEYDELIKSALQDEIEAVKGAGNEGKGKDINNIVIANRKETEGNEEGENEEQEETSEPNIENSNINVEKAKEKKYEDKDQEMGSEGEEEEDEDVVDELPPVVPKYDSMKKKKGKSLKITSLDFTSEEEDNNSDSDFKGESSEEESEYSMGSGSDSSDNNRRRRGSDGPLRRSTRARTSRYDRDFINDDSEDESPRRKKKRRSWDSSEESDSDESWGRRKRKTNKFYNRSFTSSSKKKSKKKKQKKRTIESGTDEEVKPKKPKNKRIKFGGLDSGEEDNILSRRTRGKKINYQEMNGSDSEDETVTRKSKSARVIESDDDFVAEKEDDEQIEESEEEIESGVNEEEDSDDEDFGQKRKSIEKARKGVEKKKENSIESSKEENIEKDSKEDESNNLEEESEDLDPEEEEILGDILESGEVPISELKSAVKKAKEQRRLQKEAEMREKDGKDLPETVAKTFPPIPAHLEYPGIVKNPKVGKVKITPTRAELAQQMAASNVQLNPASVTSKPANILQSVLLAKPTESQKTVNPSGVFGQGNVKLNVANIPPNHSKDDTLAPPPNPFMPRPPEMLPSGPLNMMAMMSAHPQGAGNKTSVIAPPVGKGPFNAFQSGPPPPGLPPYQTTIPATVAGLSKTDINLQGQKPEPLPGTTIKRKTDEASPPPENFGEGSQPSSVQRGEEFMQDSPPKKKVRGRGKKQLLAEAQALAEAQGKQEKPVVTIQAPTHFPPRGVPPEGGSVISRMLSAPQIFPGSRPPFRPSHPPQYPNSPIRMRVPLPGAPMFHTSHPHDPSPSGGGPINLPMAKPPPPGGTFAPRFPPDSAVRHPFPTQSSPPPPPPRPEFSSFPNYYGNFPPPNSSHPGSDDPNYQNPPSYPEQFEDAQGASGGSSSKPYEDESGGEFGGLASYFASQREDDLDT